jgi:hypothetical protein
LPALLAREETESEPNDWVDHLETCTDCRNALEALAADPVLWEDAACGLVNPARQEPTVRQLVERWKKETVPAPAGSASGASSLRQVWLLVLLLLVTLGPGLLLFRLAAGRQEPAEESKDLVYDFRKPFESLPGLTLIGPGAEEVVQTDAEGLRITLPEGRQDCRSVGIARDSPIRGDFDIDLGFEVLAVGKDIPNPAAGLQMRLSFESPASVWFALSRFRNRYAPQPADLFGVVGHDGETFAGYDITILPDDREKPHGIDVRARESRGRLKLKRTGSTLEFWVSDGGSPYQQIRSDEVGTKDVQTLELFGFSGWAPVAVDVRFTDLVLTADQLTDVSPGRVEWSKAWLALSLLAGLIVTVSLGAWLLMRRSRAA